MSEYTGLKVGAIVVGVIAVILTILLSISFSNVEFDESQPNPIDLELREAASHLPGLDPENSQRMGFKRTKSSGSVDTSQVYTSGRYMVGPDAEFKIFKASAHFERLSNVEVFTQDKLADGKTESSVKVRIDVDFQYFLRADDLRLLHDKFNLNYQTVVRNSAIDALKGKAPSYTTDQFVQDRVIVEENLYLEVRNRLGGICCARDCKSYSLACPKDCEPVRKCSTALKGLFIDVKYFQLGEVDVPHEIEEKYLKQLTLTMDTEREQFFQDSKIVRKNTEQLVRNTENMAKEISQQATAQSALIASKARANYTTIIETSRAEGLKTMYDRLGITDQGKKSSFDYLRTLRGLENIHLTVNFDQKIAGNL